MDTLIKRQRIALGMPEQQLAIASDLTLKSVSFLERGLQVPRLKNALKIASALNLSLEALYSDFVSHAANVARPQKGTRKN